jgi:hypothetical protein
MNLTTHNSPSLIPSQFAHSLEDSLRGTMLFEDKYLNNIELKIQGTLTTSYKSNYLDNIYKQAINLTNITKKQNNAVLYFFEIFRDIAEQIHPDRLKIKCVKSNDDEVCIYRKTIYGISMIAIDEDGDGFYNFTGYKSTPETIFFKSEKCDFETLIYKFLSK